MEHRGGEDMATATIDMLFIHDADLLLSAKLNLRNQVKKFARKSVQNHAKYFASICIRLHDGGKS
jgi:hypothetical protein